MNKVVIVGAKRLPIGKFGGALKDIKATDLGTYAMQGVFHSVDVDRNDIELVIMGTVLQAGQGQNPARQAAIKAGIPESVPAFTVNEVCGSGLKAIHLGMQAIQLGEQSVVMVGGFENMSQAPYLIRNARFGAKYNNLVQEDVLATDGLMDVYSNLPMGHTAEKLADKYKIARKSQDAYALLSQTRAKEAQESGYFRSEITQVVTENGIFAEDEGIRKDTTLEKLSKLKPAFKEFGSVTAGNSSTLNDGAAAILMMSEKEAKRRRLRILAYVESYQEIGMDPSLMGYAPYYAITKLLEKNKLKTEDIDLFEINEAFSVQMIAILNDLRLDVQKVNIKGGGISIGHPIGASGTRIVVSLINQLEKENKTRGIASLCMGGGMGSALLIKRG